MPEQHRVRVFDARKRCPILPIVEGEGTAWAVVWPGTGARSRSLHRISLSRHARTVELSHPMEAVYYVIEGTALAVDPKDNSRQELVEGSMVHIGSGTSYVFMEAVYYVIEGTAVAVDPKDNSRQELVEGSMVHIGSGTSYESFHRRRRRGRDRGRALMTPPDPEMYKHLEGQ